MSWLDIKSLGEEKAKLVKETRSLVNAGELSAEQTAEVEKRFARIDEITSQVERLNKIADLEKVTEERLISEERETAKGIDSPEYRTAFWNKVRNYNGSSNLEFRAVSSVGTGANAAGEFVPKSFYDSYVKVLASYAGMRQAGCTVYPTAAGENLHIPKVDDSTVSGAVVGEHVASADDSTNDVATSEIILYDWRVDSHVQRVSKKLLRNSGFPVEQWLGDVLFDRVARKQNALFTVGGGTTEPTGAVVGATDSGVDTASATAISYNNLVDLQNSLNVAYESAGECVFMMHQNTFAIVRKILDEQDRPLFGTGNIQEGAPLQLLGKRVVLNNAMATGHLAKSILYGNFKAGYVIRDIDSAELSINPYLYWATDDLGFRYTAYGDGAVVDAKAIYYLQMGSS